ncbi:MAG TPA: CapA family protein [candidate division Zixibacteria bacterium]|jgi:poly-gamma-glutamate synthesis protein (capsule biosynthesis protein)
MIFSNHQFKSFFLLSFFLLFFFLSPFNPRIEISSARENIFLPREHNLILVGDIMLSRGVDLMIKERGYLYPFKNIAEITNSAEIAFGNLESPLSKRGMKGDQIYAFRGNPESIKGLIYAGFDVLNLANNHSYDYGRKAFEETLKFLKQNNIRTIGAGENIKDARKPAVFDLGDLKVAFLGYDLSPGAVYAGGKNPGVAKIKSSWIIEDIEKAKKEADLIVVSFHWGIEYDDFPAEYQKSLAHMVIDCGADIVVGHHPHTFQGIEVYKGKLIAYSLGNFIFDQKDLKNNQSIILKVTLHGKNLFQAEIIPIELVTFPRSPKIAEGKIAQEILGRLNYNSSVFGTEFIFYNGRGYIEMGINPR